MTNRMDTVFGEMMAKGEKILILYFPIGDTIFGNEDVEWGKRYFNNGATVLEIGLPYENPIYDGGTVKASMARALENTTMDKVFANIKELRRQCPDNILQIMCYYEIIQRYGAEEFARIAEDCGVDAVLSPNVPVPERHMLDEVLGAHGMYFLRFANFHLDDEMINDLKTNVKGGYVFQQAVDGATGEQPTVSPQIGVNVKLLKDAKVQAAICAGFGISNAKQVAEAVGMGADGVIVGSATINHILAGDGEEFIKSLSEATK